MSSRRKLFGEDYHGYIFANGQWTSPWQEMRERIDKAQSRRRYRGNKLRHTLNILGRRVDRRMRPKDIAKWARRTLQYKLWQASRKPPFRGKQFRIDYMEPRGRPENMWTPRRRMITRQTRDYDHRYGTKGGWKWYEGHTFLYHGSKTHNRKQKRRFIKRGPRTVVRDQ